MLFNINTLEWDTELLSGFCIPPSVLPDVVPNAHQAGSLDGRIAGAEVALGGLCVDQQAALLGQRCLNPGDAKVTYGTGCFMLVNIGPRPEVRAPGLLTSVAWQVGHRTDYALDGGIYCGGSTIRWLIDGVGLAGSVEELEESIGDSEASEGVYFVPALAGLAAPFWQRDAVGGWHGLRLSTRGPDLIRSAVESIAYRVKDVMDAVAGMGIEVREVRVDGGLTQNEFLMQFQADLLGLPLLVFKGHEATAFGAALLAGLASGRWSLADIERFGYNAAEVRYEPRLDNTRPRDQYSQWRTVLRRFTES